MPASGFLAPGFVDVHAHTNLVRNPAAQSKLHQGVTLDITGPDGGSAFRNATSELGRNHRKWPKSGDLDGGGVNFTRPKRSREEPSWTVPVHRVFGGISVSWAIGSRRLDNSGTRVGSWMPVGCTWPQDSSMFTLIPTWCAIRQPRASSTRE